MENVVNDGSRSNPDQPQHGRSGGSGSRPPVAVRFWRRFRAQSRGTAALNLSLAVVTGYAIAALAGWVTPLAAAIVGLGAQVVGTIAFFVSYWIGDGGSHK
ncbi:MAG: hypothetical protein LBG44_04695 [Gemmatimonadota bacterium]|jgi:hypothetical protein|nr:hypothetical protein [Gemmatimonadota bacterium]